tara:strand:- start:29 stop:235 length:207 start_codon:yes stop_codon:yes gene_type:complete
LNIKKYYNLLKETSKLLFNVLSGYIKLVAFNIANEITKRIILVITSTDFKSVIFFDNDENNLERIATP